MAKVNEQDDYDPSADETTEDFSYDETSYDDTSLDDDLTDESWDNNYEEDAQGEADEGSGDQPASKKKKGGLFNIILIMVVALGGGGFMYLKFGGSPAAPVAPAPLESSAEPNVAQMPTSSQIPDPVVAPAVTQVDQAVTDGPLLPEPAAPDTLLVETEDQSEAALSTQGEPPTLALSEPVGQQPVEVASEPPMPSPISELPDSAASAPTDFKPSLPSAQDIMLAKPVSQDFAAPVPEVSGEAAAQALASGDSLKAVDQKLSVLLARMDSFEGRIANLETGLHQMSSKIGGGSDSAQMIAGMKDTLTALEDKVNTLALAPVAEPPAPASVKTKALPQLPTETDSIEGQAEAPVFVPAQPDRPDPTEVEQAVSSPSQQAVVERPAVTTRISPPKAEGWILRSAQPGTAMVASKVTGDMRSVKVGDSLPGIGKINSIELQNGRWVVKGSLSSLTH